MNCLSLSRLCTHVENNKYGIYTFVSVANIPHNLLNDKLREGDL